MFKLTKIVNGRNNVSEPEYLEVKSDEAVVAGEALVLSSGKLTKCGATAKPEYIAGAELAASATDRIIPAVRVESNHVYEVPVTVAPTSLVIGAKVTLSADGLGVTATTTSGVASIVALNGATKANDKILVRF